MSDPLDDLSGRGVWIWLDDLSRQRLATGSLAAVRDRAIHERAIHERAIHERAIHERRAGNERE
jgi:hypothetical protein